MSKFLTYFLASRFLFLLFAVLAINFLPLQQGYIGQQFDEEVPYLAWIWANFDGRHFLNIATQGYQRFDFAFFPLYPFLISALGYIFPIGHLYLGVFVSSLSFLVAAFLLYKITKLDFKKNTAILSVFLLFFFPLSFFGHSVYSDSLFLFLSTASFYFARKKSWVVSGVFGGLATLTRLAGIALVPALAAEWYFQDKKRLRALVAPLLVLSGLAVYMLYLNVNFADPLLFQKSMVAWRQSEIVFPSQVVFRYLKIFWSVAKDTLVFWIAILEFVSIFAYLALGVYMVKKVRISYGVFMLTLLLLLPFTGTFAGNPRYLIQLFPGFIGLALLLKKYKKLRRLTAFAFLGLGFILTALFTRGYFVS